MVKVLVTGANGQLGSELKSQISQEDHKNFIFTDIDELDILNSQELKQFFNSYEFSHVINCAGYTNVDKAEVEPEKAYQLNVIGPKNLSELCLKKSCQLIHISTDFIFDGEKKSPYDVDDKPSPLSVYGQTKYEGESVVLQTNPNGMIIRTSWLYSSYGRNFVKTIIGLLNEKESISVVDDQIGSPTYAYDLAFTILHIINNFSLGKTQIYHYSNEGVISWYDFAIEIKNIIGSNCRILPVSSKNYNAKATRPRYSVMNIDKIINDFEVPVIGWKDSLQICISVLKTN